MTGARVSVLNMTLSSDSVRAGAMGTKLCAQGAMQQLYGDGSACDATECSGGYVGFMSVRRRASPLSLLRAWRAIRAPW